MGSGRFWKQIDKGFLTVLALISLLGLVTLWSASHGAEGRVADYAVKQLQWMGIGVVAMAACAFLFDYRHVQANAYGIYFILLVLLVVVLVAGKSSMGAQRWLGFGGIRFQPSEFAKIGMAIVMARILSDSPHPAPYGLRALILPAVLAAVPTALVAVQPDLGTAALLLGVAAAAVSFQGIRRKILIGGGIAGLAAAPLFWASLKAYQRQRILTFLDPERDPMGAGYHIIQSKIAVGSGQLLGKGYLKGTQSHLRFLPERHTDFIFSVLSEEWGFLGGLLVLVLFFLLVLWGLDVAARARDTYGRLLAVGLTSILFFHVAINVGMVMGLFPVVGVPLPFFSYGGSSVLTVFIIAGLLLNVRMKRFYRP